MPALATPVPPRWLAFQKANADEHEDKKHSVPDKDKLSPARDENDCAGGEEQEERDENEPALPDDGKPPAPTVRTRAANASSSVRLEKACNGTTAA